MTGWGFTERPACTLTNAVFRAWGGFTGVKNAVANAQMGGHWMNSPHGNNDGSFVQSVRITIEEAAALQSYPPDFRWDATMPSGRPITKGKVGLVIGNAVPVLLASAVLEALWKESA